MATSCSTLTVSSLALSNDDLEGTYIRDFSQLVGGRPVFYSVTLEGVLYWTETPSERRRLNTETGESLQI